MSTNLYHLLEEQPECQIRFRQPAHPSEDIFISQEDYIKAALMQSLKDISKNPVPTDNKLLTVTETKENKITSKFNSESSKRSYLSQTFHQDQPLNAKLVFTFKGLKRNNHTTQSNASIIRNLRKQKSESKQISQSKCSMEKLLFRTNKGFHNTATFTLRTTQNKISICKMALKTKVFNSTILGTTPKVNSNLSEIKIRYTPYKRISQLRSNSIAAPKISKAIRDISLHRESSASQNIVKIIYFNKYVCTEEHLHTKHKQLLPGAIDNANLSYLRSLYK